MRYLFVTTLFSIFAMPTAQAGDSSWMFYPGRYSHNPATGDRVAQYAPDPLIEPLPDTRPISSGYRQSRSTIRGLDGSVTSYYRVDNWSGTPGRLDAEWERFGDEWQRSFLSGGSASGRFPYVAPYRQYPPRRGFRGRDPRGFGGPGGYGY